MNGPGDDLTERWTAGEDAYGVPWYDPYAYLQGMVAEAWRQAAERDKAVHVLGPWPTISLFPSSYAAVVDGGEDRLREFAGRDDLPPADLLFTTAPLYPVRHPHTVSLDVLLWKLALGASRGRLPYRTSLETPCALREWPNFTRLVLTPGAMSIAALWTRQACTIRQTVDLLVLPPADVFAFYSAAAAIDLVRPDLPVQAAAADQGAPALAPTPRRGLLRKLLDRLRTG